MTKRIALSALAMVLALGTAYVAYTALPTATGNAQEIHTVEDLDAGDLIRGVERDAVYYLGLDGFRYVFPNSKTYFTWYENFDDVKWISDEDLTTIQIGGNVTYRPGVKMIKIKSDPKTYAVGSGGSLHHVATQEVAEALYGTNWNEQIDDVPDGFFGNYTRGSAIDVASMFDPNAEKNEAQTININKELKTAYEISVDETGFHPATYTIKANRAVRFGNQGTQSHGATATDKSWGTGTLEPGEDFRRYFEEPGTYTFYDKKSPSNTGTIIVE